MQPLETILAKQTDMQILRNYILQITTLAEHDPTLNDIRLLQHRPNQKLS